MDSNERLLRDLRKQDALPREIILQGHTYVKQSSSGNSIWSIFHEGYPAYVSYWCPELDREIHLVWRMEAMNLHLSEISETKPEDSI